MGNRTDFVVDYSVLEEACRAIESVPHKYQEAIQNIKKVTETLLDNSNWKGAARDEFKNTYRIVEHYLEDDQQRVGNIIELINGFMDIYEALDIDTAKDIVEGTAKVIDMVKGE